MTGLKTLKDINLTLYPEFAKDELRKEINKWIKDMEASQPYGKSTKFVIMWCKIFFNLENEKRKH